MAVNNRKKGAGAAIISAEQLFAEHFSNLVQSPITTEMPVVMMNSLPRREFIVNELRSIPGVTCVNPKGAFYVFPNCSAYFGKTIGDKTISNSVELADYLLDEALLATVPGAAFGADDFIRFSFATSMDILKEGMERLKAGLEKLL